MDNLRRLNKRQAVVQSNLETKKQMKKVGLTNKQKKVAFRFLYLETSLRDEKGWAQACECVVVQNG